MARQERRDTTGTPHALIVDRLVDGTGRDPVGDAVVVWQDGRVLAAGARSAVEVPPGAAIHEGDGLTALPGLIDCHVHLTGAAQPDVGRLLMTPRSLTLLHAVPNCHATLQAGVTSVRDAGYTPVGVRLAAERGFFPAPRMELAVSILSQTGGHGDSWMPCGCVLHMDPEIDVPDGVVDGVDRMRSKVREVLRAGADWIKLCTSGGVLSATDAVDEPQFSAEEVRAAVIEAASKEKRCLAHAVSASGVKTAVRAGVATIEHGCLLDEAAIALMVERGTVLVPTLSAPRAILHQAAEHPGRIPETMVAKARAISARHVESFRAAVEAGVTVAMGTDSAVGPHGENARELGYMVDAGMTPMQAILASTRNAASLLRDGADRGTLEPGRAADLIAVRGDPLADVHLFDDPQSVRLVVAGGVVARDELRAPAMAQLPGAATR